MKKLLLILLAMLLIPAILQAQFAGRWKSGANSPTAKHTTVQVDTLEELTSGHGVVVKSDLKTLGNILFTLGASEELALTDGTDTYNILVSSDKLVVQNDAGTPATIFSVDSSGSTVIYDNTTIATGGSRVGLSIDGNKTTGNLFQAINDDDGSVGDSSVVISSTGALTGYNTITANTKLVVNDSARVEETLLVKGITTLNNRANINVSGSTIGLSIDGNKTSGNLAQFINDNDGAVGDSSVVITTKGYLGIGTSNPAEELTVATSGGSTRIMATDGTVQTVIQASSASGWFGTLTAHPFNIGSASSTRMSLTSDGYLGYGTTSPVSNSFTLGTKGTQRDLIVTRENTPAATDSSAKLWIDDGNAKLGLRAGDADSLIVTCANDTAKIHSNNPMRLGISTTPIVFRGEPKYSDGTYYHRIQCAIEGWVTHDAATDTVTIGILPANAIVTNVNIWTQEAFDSDGTDEVCVGYSGTAEAYAVDVDVSDTGVETWTPGTTAKTVDATSRTVQIYYHSGDITNLSAGECHVIVEWYQATVNP